MPSKPETAAVAKTGKAVPTSRKRKRPPAHRIVVVLGMHRSGTSVITRALAALGADLGDNLMESVAGNNDKGFWEDVDFNRLNERVLAKCGSSWNRLSALPNSHFYGSEFAPERMEAAKLVQKKMANSEVFAFKDPRTAVLLAFWKCVFEDISVEPQYIICVRNPLEVAESLRKRDGFDLVKSLVLWLKHVHPALRETQGSTRLFVKYDDVLSDPEAQLARMAEALDLKMPAPGSAAMLEYQKDFLDASLQHHSISSNELGRNDSIPKAVQQLYALLDGWCDADPGETLTSPDALTAEIDTYLSDAAHLLGYADRIEDRVSTVGKRANAAEAQVKSLEAVRQDLIAKTGELDALKAREADLQSKVKLLEEVRLELAARTGERDALRKQETELQAQVKSLEAVRRDLVAQAGELDAVKAREADLQSRVKALEGVRQELASRTSERDALRQRETELQAKVKSLEEVRQGLVAKTAELDAAEQREAELRATVASLETLRDELALKTSELEAAGALEDELRAEVKSLEAVRDELAAKSNELDAAKLREEELQGQVTALEAVRQDLASKARELEAATARENQVRAEYATLERDLEDVRTELLSVQELSEELKKDIAASEQARAELESAKAGLADKISSVQAELSASTGRVAELKQGLNASESALNKSQEEVARLRSDLKASVEKLDTSRTRVASLEKDLQLAKQNAEQQATKFAEATSRITQLTSELSASNATHNDLRTALNLVQDELIAALADVESQQKVTAERQAELQKKETETEALLGRLASVEALKQASDARVLELELQAKETGDVLGRLETLEALKQASDARVHELELQAQETGDVLARLATLESLKQASDARVHELELQAQETGDVLARVATLESLKQASDARVRELEAKVKETGDVLGRLASLDTLKQASDARVRELEAKAKETGDVLARLASLEAMKQASDARVRELEQQLAQQSDAARRDAALRDAELVAAKEKLDQISASAATELAVAADLRKELRLIRASVLEMRNSTSWRLTRPIRAFKTVLRSVSSTVTRKGN